MVADPERDTERDTARREVARRGLTPDAATHLTRDALGRIDLDKLAPLKGFLKQFFSESTWTEADDDALAEIVGPGEGWWRHDLDEFDLEFGWRDGAFRLDVTRPRTADPATPAAPPTDRASFAESFAGSVVPEATPNPRTIRFVTGPIHDGPSRWYDSVEGVDDPRVERLFADFDDVANVLVGPDFVAVGLRRPDRWEAILTHVLRTVTTEFVPGASPTGPSVAPDPTGAGARERTRAQAPPSAEREGALARAWRQLGTLRADEGKDVDAILAAAASSDSAERQVAARLLVDADREVATAAWAELLDDGSRAVRRATVDAMVDAEAPEVRPLLERSLGDTDAWIRWKALRGLVDLGIEPSRSAVATLVEDPDFRVRLEAAGALRN